MAESNAYLLGRSQSELTRLSRQMSELAPDSEVLLDKIGIRPGERIIDIGCGPGGVLDLLAQRVGPSGSVLGIERSPRFVDLARRFIEDKTLTQAEVREGDAYDTGLPGASFDGAHMRLVLVNVPQPERIVREMVSLVRPGGWVASFEADYLAHYLRSAPTRLDASGRRAGRLFGLTRHRPLRRSSNAWPVSGRGRRRYSGRCCGARLSARPPPSVDPA